MKLWMDADKSVQCVRAEKTNCLLHQPSTKVPVLLIRTDHATEHEPNRPERARDRREINVVELSEANLFFCGSTIAPYRLSC